VRNLIPVIMLLVLLFLISGCVLIKYDGEKLTYFSTKKQSLRLVPNEQGDYEINYMSTPEPVLQAVLEGIEIGKTIEKINP